MTKNARWSIAVRDRDGNICRAHIHDPRCRGIGEHPHHIYYKSHIPAALYWVVDNGIWLSLLCHDLAHKTHNASIPAAYRRRASVTMRKTISETFPHKPELLLSVPLFEEAA